MPIPPIPPVPLVPAPAPDPHWTACLVAVQFDPAGLVWLYVSTEDARSHLLREVAPVLADDKHVRCMLSHLGFGVGLRPAQFERAFTIVTQVTLNA